MNKLQVPVANGSAPKGDGTITTTTLQVPLANGFTSKGDGTKTKTKRLDNGPAFVEPTRDIHVKNATPVPDVTVSLAVPVPPKSKSKVQPNSAVRINNDVTRKAPPPSGFRRVLQALGILKPPPKKVDPDEPDLDVTDPMIIFWFFKFSPDWIIITDSDSYYNWLTLISIAILYNILAVPMRVVFSELDDEATTSSFMAADYTCDALYFIDVFVNMLSGYLSEDLLVVEEPRKLFRHWLGSTVGKLDIISILPTDLMFIWTGTRAPFPIVRINRFLKYGRFTNLLYLTENKLSNPDFFRLFGVIFQFFLLIHLNACLYYFLSDVVGLNSDGWVYPANVDWRKKGEGVTNADDTLSQKYTWSFYWSFHTLTMIGIVIQPEQPWQFLFMTANLIVAVMLFSQILGNVSRTVLNASMQARAFRTRMDGAMHYLHQKNIAKDIQERVIQYFEYQWINKRFVDDKEALACLPEKIESELLMKVHLATLKHVRIFQGVEPGLLVDLVLKLKLQVYAPGDYICRKGDIGKELYIVKKGCLEVVSDSGETVFARLGEGSVFGEISILNIAGIKSGNRRTANVRSIGYADLFCLSKHDLWEALQEYPEGKNKMLEIGREILLRDNLLNVQDAEDEGARHQKFLQQLIRVEDGIEHVQFKFGRLLAERSSAIHKLKIRIKRLEHLNELEEGRRNLMANDLIDKE